MEDFIGYSVAIILIGLLIVILKKVPRTKGVKSGFHIAFVSIASLVLLFVPDFIQNIIFSPEGVLMIGTLIPVYESIKAVVSISEDDDISWLQFWLASGSFTYCTEWMDVVAESYPAVAEHWYEGEFLILLWLLLPYTDGSTLIFNVVTQPLLAPFAKTVKDKVEGKMSLFMIIINSGYLWVVWFTFLTLEEEAKRFIVVAVGTIYPISASTIACTVQSYKRDDTFWLTYWICFSLLFISMDYLETFVGSIQGFYSICLCSTIYLFLPLFKGAEVVFRKIIVPLSGQYEQMLLKDIYVVKQEMVKNIPAGKRDSVFSKVIAMFDKDKDE